MFCIGVFDSWVIVRYEIALKMEWKRQLIKYLKKNCRLIFNDTWSIGTDNRLLRQQSNVVKQRKLVNTKNFQPFIRLFECNYTQLVEQLQNKHNNCEKPTSKCKRRKKDKQMPVNEHQNARCWFFFMKKICEKPVFCFLKLYSQNMQKEWKCLFMVWWFQYYIYKV